jgi:heavy metal translocating P-type ATPase
MVRDTGVEPVSKVWKTFILTAIRIPHKTLFKTGLLYQIISVIIEIKEREFMLKKIRHFFKEYRHLGIVIIAVMVAIGLIIAGQNKYANLVLGLTAGISAIPLVWDMIQDLRDGKYGVDILAATAIISSVLLKEYWAGMIIVLMLTGGEALEDYAESRAKTELDALLSRAPKKAHILKGRKVIEVLASAVQKGDKLIIKPGELIPVDAVVLEGEASLDESSLTGESLPVEKRVGDELLSGSVNLDGSLTVKALRVASESQYEQIIKLVKSAASSQSPFVRLADKYSIPFTILAFIIAGTVWAISGDAIRFLEVIVVATPCPLLLGAPIALISGMSRAAKHGIIIKTGSAMEKLAQVKTVAFDKTGTLTIGKPVVNTLETFNSFSSGDVLLAAASIETHSNHILAQAIVKSATDKKIKLSKASSVKEHAGFGLSGQVNRQPILVGKANLLAENNIDIPVKYQNAKTTASFIAINGELAGMITFTDELRAESKSTLQRLKVAGIKHILMVTGDNKTSASAIAKQVGVTDIRADCLPADKLRAIEAIKDRPVAFVGDGVNDAPVLTASDVGIALGARGSAAASESADVVIMLDDLSRVASAVEIAKYTFFIAKQSILVGIFISIGLMLIFATGRFKPIYGAALQEVVDVIVIFNALRAHGSWKKKQAILPS